jgi:hypothetical protein
MIRQEVTVLNHSDVDAVINYPLVPGGKLICKPGQEVTVPIGVYRAQSRYVRGLLIDSLEPMYADIKAKWMPEEDPFGVDADNPPESSEELVALEAAIESSRNTLQALTEEIEQLKMEVAKLKVTKATLLKKPAAKPKPRPKPVAKENANVTQ